MSTNVNKDVIDLTDDKPPSSPTIAPCTPTRPLGTKREREPTNDDDDSHATKRQATGGDTKQPVPTLTPPATVEKAGSPTQPVPQRRTATTLSEVTSSPRATATIAATSPTPSGPKEKAPTPPLFEPTAPHVPVPNKPFMPLKDMPHIHPRYVEESISPLSPTLLRDPNRFVMKPFYWRRWTRAQYTALAHDFTAQYDPTPFARHHGIPVQEIQAVFAALVAEPIQDAADKDCIKKVEARMEASGVLYSKHGERMREWETTDGDFTARAECTGVAAPGVVELCTNDGMMELVAFEELRAEDQEYISGIATKEEMEELRKSAIWIQSWGEEGAIWAAK